ncbi:MAG: HEAT repeat domain-containing protein, partial [Candidatus Obscuribacterales bacterium]|nr:HEAT repeat domain-containing protein [Candidatus Obscuribacterales bacterium]
MSDYATKLFTELVNRAQELQLTAVADKPSDKASDKPADKPEAKAGEKPQEKAPAADIRREVIEVANLPPAKQAELEQLRELHGMLVTYADKLKFPSDKDKKEFLDKLKKELGEAVEGQPGKFNRLPEFGDASKEGFKKLKEFFEKGHVPDLLGALDKQLLELPPGFPLKIAGKQEDILKSSEQLRQEIRQGKAYLDVDPTKLEDIRKLSRAGDWTAAAEKSLHTNYIERLEKYLNKKVEDGIKDGKYPEGWRRPDGMDKETWCSAVEQAMNQYNRMTRVIEAIDYLKKSGTNFQSAALDKENLPPGIEIKRDPSGKITNIDFSRYMIQDLRLQSDENRQKLDQLSAWCDKYEGPSKQALGEVLKDRNHVAGFGEYPVEHGWVNPATQQWTMGRTESPGGGYQNFNLLSYDMDIKEERDAFGKVTKVFVSSDVAYQEVPPYGYLNSFAEDKHRVKSEKPTEYKPDDYVAVQTGPGQVEMIQAKDLADWKTRQQIKHYGEKAITLTMDAAMVVSGFGELTAAAKVAQLGAKEAVAIGGQVMKTELATQLPKGIVGSMVRKGLFEIGLGATGVFHNAGAHEIPWMKTVSDLRTAYFLTHAGYSLASWMKAPQAVRALGEAASPGLVRAADGAITSIRGTEDFVRATQMARAGAHEAWPILQTTENVTHAAFNVSEKLFVGMFAWDAVGMTQRFRAPYRPDALQASRDAFGQADFADTSAMEKLIKAGNKPSEKTENYFRRYMDSLPGLEGKSKEEAEAIIAKVKELSKPGTKEEDKQKYLQELMKYFRYDGNAINKLQDNKFKESQLSEAKLTETAQGDKTNFDPNVRKIAAMAMLALSRKPDGSWPETITQRTERVPEFTELIQSDEVVLENKVGPLDIKQEIKADELVKLLGADLREETDAAKRLEKAAAMHETGLVSGEQLGDLLLSRIEGAQGVSKEERLRAITDLAGLVSRLKVEEKLREGSLAARGIMEARGATAGLSSADLLKRLEKVAQSSDDKDIKATSALALTLLRKENLDNTDRDRIRDFFLKDPPGIKEDELAKILEADAASKPTTKEAWERKLLAAEMILRNSMQGEFGKIDKKAAEQLLECLRNKEQPEIAARALKALTADGEGGSPLTSLNMADPEGKWLNKIAFDAINNLTPPQGQEAVGKQLEAAKARLQIIEAVTAMVKDSDDKALKRAVVAKLMGRADSASESVAEVRAAALRAIGNMGVKDKEQMDLLKRCVDSKTEASPAVRMAALDAIESLVARNKERREMLAPLASSEPDAAVRERIARYYDPTGSIRDRNSQRSRQEVADARTQQNQEYHTAPDIDNMLKARFPALAGGTNNIFKYVDPATVNHETWGFMQDRFTNLARVWDSSVSTIESFWTQGFVKDIARTNLIYFELIAQNAAVRAFNKGVDDLSTAAMSGSDAKTVQVGGKTVSEKDAAVLSLGSLVRNGSRMGDPFMKTRDSQDRSAGVEPGFRELSARQERDRNSYASRNNLEIYGPQNDPWPATERRIAEKMRDLCSQSSDKVNLKLLKDEILRALGNDSKASDQSRKILVDGLDRLLSNPQTSPEAKREILKKAGELVRGTQEVEINKSESTVAMIALLDKHGKASFETYSDAYAAMRTAVTSRAENDKMPPQLRMRAQEMFDRQWLSVLAENDRISPPQGTARTRAELLPKNTEALEKNKEGKVDGFDEDVHDAVQRILMATKGLPLEVDDPRFEQLKELTSDKYDDRVRLAAGLALSQARSGQWAAESTLLDIALNSKDRALRQDAAAIMMRMPPFMVSEGSLESSREAVLDKLAAALGKNRDDLVGKAPDEMIKEANEFIEKNRNSTDARVKEQARDLQETLRKYGEGLGVIANLKLFDKNDRAEAERLFKLSLNAFGIKDSDLTAMQNMAKRNSHRPGAESQEIRDLTKRLIDSMQDGGNVQALMNTLNGYAKLSVAEVVPATGGVKVESLQRSVGLLSLSESLTS